MGRQWSNSVVTDVPLVNAAETAAIVTNPVSSSLDGDQIAIAGSLNILTGASVTGIVIRIRRGNGVAGTVVGDTPPYTIGAAASVEIPFNATDSPGPVAGQQYTVTVVQTAGSTNGTVTRSSATVTVGQP